MRYSETFARAAFAIVFVGAFGITLARAAKSPASAVQHHPAGAKKTGAYAQSGFFSGGSRTISSATLKDIRRGPQGSGVERIVFDVDSHGGPKESVPFFQVNINPDENRLLVSFWADVTYDIDTAKLANSFSKSSHVRKVNLIPRVEDGLATVELVLNNRGRQPVKVEAFYLTHPGRIILDIL